MNRNFLYNEKNVHDIQVQDMVVRLWSAEGSGNRHEIKKMLIPLAKTGFVYPYMALMPDWHPGADLAIVGSVIPTKEVLLPSMIGGDIGCGMLAVRLPITLSELSNRFESIASHLREKIPSGSSQNSVVSDRVLSNPLWQKELKAPVSNRTFRKLSHQFASLGGGNHFLEIQCDQEEYLWIMLHSGSRYLGIQVRDWYVEQGSQQSGIDKKIYARIPYLVAGNEIANDYLLDMRAVQEFARESRKEMMIRAIEVIQEFSSTLDIINIMAAAIEVSHNYAALESYFDEQLYIHRKGAFHIPKGELGLVPGSMGTSSYVVEGRGNDFAFCSCAHGGGRAMSRSVAAKSISEKAFRESMKNIVYNYNELFIDEAPDAYKDIRTVMRGQKDLVKIRYELKPVVSIKGH
ncbi:MAG: RtcB family protein [Chitinispirillaceae bacterium]|jgi:tRNA-splicing ligase RtcB